MLYIGSGGSGTVGEWLFGHNLACPEFDMSSETREKISSGDGD